MELKIKKSYWLVISFLLISLSLILSNGCKKSEPAADSSSSNMSAMSDEMENMPTEAVTADNGQKTCPVMKGNPIDTDIFVEYQGKKVYFCCDDCKAAFLKSPEKYVADLPQFKEQEN